MLRLSCTFLLFTSLSLADFRAAVGQFTKAAGTPSYTQTVTDATFGGRTPIAIIIWTTGQTTTGFGTNANFAMGFGTAAARGGWSYSSLDGSATSTAAESGNTAQLIQSSDSGTSTVIEQGTSPLTFGVNSFTLTWTVGGSSGVLYNYIMLGGTDLTAQEVVGNPFASTGTQDLTTFSFQPDFLLIGGRGGTAHAVTAMGVAVSSSARWTISSMADNGVAVAANDKNSKSLLETAVFQQINSNNAILCLADFTSFLSNGARFNVTTARSANTSFFGLKGARYAVGSYSKATGGAPASQSISGLGFKPILVVQTSVHAVASGAVQSDLNMSLGAATALSSVDSAWYQKNVTLNTVADRYNNTSEFMSLVTGPSTQDAVVTLTSMDSGGWTESWTTNTGTADDIAYFAIGSAAYSTPIKHRTRS